MLPCPAEVGVHVTDAEPGSLIWPRRQCASLRMLMREEHLLATDSPHREPWDRQKDRESVLALSRLWASICSQLICFVLTH